jgi:phosphatidylserine decarboxylase precursor
VHEETLGKHPPATVIAAACAIEQVCTAVTLPSRYNRGLFISLAHSCPTVLPYGPVPAAQAGPHHPRRQLRRRASGRAHHPGHPLVRKALPSRFERSRRSDPASYKTFNDFFTRALRADARPLANADFLCPVDGAISQFGRIEGEQIFQAKGHHYSTTALVGGDAKLAAGFADGAFATLYLSPRDYHRIHMPVDGRLMRMIHVPGELFSVNPATARGVPGLFARNERVVCVFEGEFGSFILVLVGATIVGSMATVWHGRVNPPRSGKIREWSYDGQQILLRKARKWGASCSVRRSSCCSPRTCYASIRPGHRAAQCAWARAWPAAREHLSRLMKRLSAFSAFSALAALALASVAPDGAADALPIGDCADPQAATDLSQCDFSRQKLVRQEPARCASGGRANGKHGLPPGRSARRRLARQQRQVGQFQCRQSGAADLRDADLFHATFDDANLSKSKLQRANLFGANLINTKAQGADFSGAYLKDILMEGIDLSGGSIRNCNALRGVFSDARLVGTDLSGADLTGAAMDSADLSNSTLKGTRLAGATLRHALFKGANLDSADFSNADLWDANFQQATNLDDSVRAALAEPFVVRGR